MFTIFYKDFLIASHRWGKKVWRHGGTDAEVFLDGVRLLDIAVRDHFGDTPFEGKHLDDFKRFLCMAFAAGQQKSLETEEPFVAYPPEKPFWVFVRGPNARIDLWADGFAAALNVAYKAGVRAGSGVASPDPKGMPEDFSGSPTKVLERVETGKISLDAARALRRGSWDVNLQRIWEFVVGLPENARYAL
jgi:hypothetical protein